MKVPGILKNKYVCYALMALAALNVIGYLTVKAWECLALFSLTAYSVHSYCGDKSLAILAALFVANFVFGCGRVKEGFEDAFKGAAGHLQDAQHSVREAAQEFECKVKQDGDNAACAASGAQASESACTAASPTTGTDAEKAANACQWLEKQVAFVASQTTCCDGATQKSGLSTDETTACGSITCTA